jgi:hypothetical protein
MIRAPLRKRNVVPRTERGLVMGEVTGAARRVLNRHGKNR